ncbi:hypothetical protein CXB51_004729 [Gossypium anomalum]|uniref:C2H2-type domain-containing protein n=1 Tax=Gossypium anomalum TaxID=47600 RepID=A0A8J5Z8A7_9ROSI|nr:hypothetical protein CXB51_004729 [Gossypium anomalum]
MANCLILLAQGKSRESPKDMLVYEKFTSRKFLETASNGTGKAGYYVYECKTCNRTFPSFQALGGHRASHKKPKATLSEAAMVEAAYEEQGPNNNNNNSKVKVKVHECSICGAEFTSGQALGGHMRRHRGSVGSHVNVLTTNTTLSLTVPMALESEKPKKPPNVLSLRLDLNLPARKTITGNPNSPLLPASSNNNNLLLSSQPPLWWIAITKQGQTLFFSFLFSHFFQHL